MRPELQSAVESRSPGARVSEIAGDASTRRFFRVQTAPTVSYVVMDYGKPFVGETDDQKLTQIFVEAGLPVARILGAMPDPGCLFLEDLGAKMLEDELGGAGDQGQVPELLLRAAELAGRIARYGTRTLASSKRADGPVLDSDRFCFEMDFFLKNFVGKHTKINADQSALRGRLHDLAHAAASTPSPVLCHRDFHCRNIMLDATGSLALVDIQDARWGPDTYDFASLAYDAYTDHAESWLDPLLTRYLETAGINDDERLRHRVHLVATQRMIKALGTFGYQISVVGNRRYVDAIPRTLTRLERILPREAETSGIHRDFRALGLFDLDP